jgi:membrane protease YdiL (CAAX protease family)
VSGAVEPPPRVWTVFVAYGLAFVAIVLASVLAVSVLHALDPDLREAEVVQGFPGLVAGAVASSTALLVTFLAATRGMAAARIRLVPGRETGRDLGVMILGVLALGQALDSITVIAGLSNHGAMATIRRALFGASGPDLFLAVIVIGILAGSVEELFFRAYMQSVLGERWSREVAILVTSAAFGLLHLDRVHAPLAFVLGVYLGFVTEISGSALPAMACHVVNNVVFTIVTALVGSVAGLGTNVVLLLATTITVTGCVRSLVRRVAESPPSAHR